MRYFTPELIAASNDWVEQTRPEFRRAGARLNSAWAKYQRELDGLKPRLSGPAWDFFRHGSGERGLHDARLLSLTLGDGLEFVADGRLPFRLNKHRTSAVLEFLNYEQTLHYLFDLRGVSSVSANLFVDEDSYSRSIGGLNVYELTAVDKQTLQLGILFATGASLGIQFQKLVFRKRRISRQFALEEIYS